MSYCGTLTCWQLTPCVHEPLTIWSRPPTSASAVGPPQWGQDRTSLDIRWLSSVLGVEIVRADLVDLKGAGGLSGASVKRVEIVGACGGKNTLIIKDLDSNKLDLSRNLGLTREAEFFHHYGAKMRDIAKIYYSYGNPTTGDKFMLMEDLGAGVQSGYFFGPGSPLNWGKDLEAIKKKVKNAPTAEQVTHEAFQSAARFHAQNWQNNELQHIKWLRGSVWTEQDWRTSQTTAISAWEKVKNKEICVDVKFDEEFVKTMDASLARAKDWDLFQQEYPKRKYTLVHGDFHPANMMWMEGRHSSSSSPLVVLDWEVVGVGSGPQDLSQYVISHMAPEQRQKCEKKLVEDYYHSLVQLGVKDYDWDTCWRDYVSGGSERWVWLMAILCDLCQGSAASVQYFHDQVAAFCRDHNITAATVGAPRV